MLMRAFRSLFLALILALAQGAGLAHALGHYHDHQEHGLPDAQACEQCLLYGHLAAALPGTSPALLLAGGDVGEPGQAMARPFCPVLCAYLSRAPPAIASNPLEST